MQKYCSEECQTEAKRLRKKRQQDLINGIEPIMDLQHQEYLTFSKAAILMQVEGFTVEQPNGIRKKG